MIPRQCIQPLRGSLRPPPNPPLVRGGGRQESSRRTKILHESSTDWQSLVGDTAAPVNFVRDYYRFLNLLGIQNLDLDDPAASARMGCLARFSQILADFEHVTRRARYVEEAGQRVFRGGQNRGVCSIDVSSTTFSSTHSMLTRILKAKIPSTSMPWTF